MTTTRRRSVWLFIKISVQLTEAESRTFLIFLVTYLKSEVISKLLTCLKHFHVEVFVARAIAFRGSLNQHQKVL